MKILANRRVLGLILVSGLLMAACAPFARVTPNPPATATSAPTTAPATSSTIANLSTHIDVPPFPYSAPLPPPIPSAIDGLYSRMIAFQGTPVPCRRCVGYRVEGGLWTLYFDKGIFKEVNSATGFTAVGSFAVSGNKVTLFNDPNCEENLKMVGTYTWVLDGNSLLLKAVDDSCAINLRAKNLTATAWVKSPATPGQALDPCQPPNREAAITGHWAKPAGCS